MIVTYEISMHINVNENSCKLPKFYLKSCKSGCNMYFLTTTRQNNIVHYSIVHLFILCFKKIGCGSIADFPIKCMFLLL